MSTTQHPTEGTPIKDVPKIEEVKALTEEEILAAEEEAKLKAEAEALAKKKKK